MNPAEIQEEALKRLEQVELCMLQMYKRKLIVAV